MPVGLVLEGGGMRGAFTSGVLDVFLKNKLAFPYVSAISAGACNALGFLSRQYGWSFTAMATYISDPRYLSVQNLIRHGSLFGYTFIFEQIPRELVPFDYEAFYKNPAHLQIGATDLETGQCVYFNGREMDEHFSPAVASASLPFVSRIVSHQGYQLLDGGCSEPIPLAQAQRMGYEKNVVVLTQHRGYRKNRSGLSRAVLNTVYRDYPNFVDALLRRTAVYNAELDRIDRLEDEGKIVVIRPNEPVEVARYEKSPERLTTLYNQGVRVAEKSLAAVVEFLSANP